MYTEQFKSRASNLFNNNQLGDYTRPLLAPDLFNPECVACAEAYDLGRFYPQLLDKMTSTLRLGSSHSGREL